MADKVIKVVVFTGNRADYGLLEPIITELAKNQSFEVYLFISGSHLLNEYGHTIQEISFDRIKEVITIKIDEPDMEIGQILSKIIGFASDKLKEILPDIVIIAGDRYETLGMSLAAYYNNLPVAHFYGGDVSQGGHLDDSVRHAITKLSHLHFTTSEDSYNRVLKLGEEEWRIYNIGATAYDHIKKGKYASPVEVACELNLDLNKPIILFTQHPISTEADLAYSQVKPSLEALKELKYQTVITYPSNDPGSKEIIKGINEYKNCENFIIRKSLGWKLYIGCMAVASCVVGNSSSGLIETIPLRIPCINIGNRQKGRLKALNVIDTGYDKNEIKEAINRAVNHKDVLLDNLQNPYTFEDSIKSVSEVLRKIKYDRRLIQKRITY